MFADGMGTSTSQVAQQLAAASAGSGAGAAATASLQSWSDPLALALSQQAQPGGPPLQQLSPVDAAQEAVAELLASKAALSVDDALDALPLMLPVVQLIEKAQQLPSDVPVRGVCI